MDRLPLHLLSSVLKYALERDGSKTQVSLLTVNSAFYLAAIPTLYHSPRISERLDSFFLHSGTIEREARDQLSSAELIRAGHTKLAALRHVRSLYIRPSQQLVAPIEGRTEDEKATDLEELRVGLERAVQSLLDLEVGAFPNLRNVYTGSSTFDIIAGLPSPLPPRDTLIMSSLGVGLLVAARDTLQSWCWRSGFSDGFSPCGAAILQHTRTLYDGRPIPPSAYTWLDGWVIPVTHIHAELVEPIFIVPGGLNYIYIHDDANRMLALSTTGATATLASQVDELIARHIAGTMRLIMNRLVEPDRRRAAIDQTRLVVAFDFPFGEKSDGKEREVSSLLARSLAIVKDVKAMAIAGRAGQSEMKEMENLQIEARVWGDMPACEIGF